MSRDNVREHVTVLKFLMRKTERFYQRSTRWLNEAISLWKSWCFCKQRPRILPCFCKNSKMWNENKLKQN